MRTLALRILFLLAGYAGMLAPLHAAAVKVQFIEPEQFTDIGTDHGRRQEAQTEIKRFIVALGERELPAEETLEVDITDVDLAGIARPETGRPDELRIVKGRADAPRISLRYRLGVHGRAVKSGSADLVDLAYLDRLRPANESDAFPYEKRLLAQWFRTTFGAQAGQGK